MVHLTGMSLTLYRITILEGGNEQH
jgi:hypothetical protein